MNRKKKVLFLTESHQLASGFGTYAKQVLSRLAATGKYELAEFASYGDPNAVGDLDWHYYGNLPTNPQESELYNSNPAHAFGIWRFGNVVLHFKPDILITYRDPWMDNWISHNPMRKYFHWAWMPTVDSAPQKRSWLETFSECDAIFTYSEFGAKTLKDQAGESINLIGCASPGIEADLYSPVDDKALHKASYGLQPDSFIVGTVMRNQRRKLFVELMKSFRLFLDRAPKDIAKKSFLYLHTSYPEGAGWDIGRAILEQRLAHKVLCTYICRNCQRWFPSKFKEVMTTCKFCGARAAFMPNVGMGLTIPELIKVYNLFDLYAQYAICEGFGMPQVEAASCGVPITATNYSAMEDVIHHTNGFPISIDKMFRELETDAERAYPSNESLAKILLDYSKSSPDYRAERSQQAREGAIGRYSWDETASIWESYIDSYNPVELQGRWDSPPNMLAPPTQQIKDIPDNADFVNTVMFSINRQQSAFSQEAASHISSLNFGTVGGNEPFNRDKFIEAITRFVNENNQMEAMRTGMAPPPPVFFFKEKRNDT
jgi:glycosyltransferase involved in cell wall biosynthesis